MKNTNVMQNRTSLVYGGPVIPKIHYKVIKLLCHFSNHMFLTKASPQKQTTKGSQKNCV